MDMDMDIRSDFLEWLGPDASTAVLTLLDDPADLARVCAVSSSWRRFVIANGFGKSLCLRISPHIPSFSHIAEVSSSSKITEVGSSAAAQWESWEREHCVYLYLSHCLDSPRCEKNCIDRAICASSTDNYPDESIENTLDSSELVEHRPSYWSSGGQRDPQVPESLTYKLAANLCIVDEIRIQPFRAFFQYGNPIYSAKSVRFWMGYSKSAQGISTCTDHQPAVNENYHWTYTSPEFPMVQDDILQSFKLPKPVICLGGVLQIDLLGRVQKQAVDDLYYICVCHVQVMGRPLSPVLDLDVLGSAGLALKYFPDARSCIASEPTAEDDSRESSSWNSFAARLRHLGGVRWNQIILSTLLGPIQFSDDDGDDGDGDGSLEGEPTV